MYSYATTYVVKHEQYVVPVNNTHITAVEVTHIESSTMHITCKNKFLISRSVSSLSGVIYFFIPSLMRSDSVRFGQILSDSFRFCQVL